MTFKFSYQRSKSRSDAEYSRWGDKRIFVELNDGREVELTGDVLKVDAGGVLCVLNPEGEITVAFAAGAWRDVYFASVIKSI